MTRQLVTVISCDAPDCSHEKKLSQSELPDSQGWAVIYLMPNPLRASYYLCPDHYTYLEDHE